LKNSESTIRIEKIVNGGFGLGRLDDRRIVMVGMVLPGEVVRIGVIEEKRQYLYARAIGIEEPHPARIPPPCPWYGQCGGCDLQHCDDGMQLLIKSDILRDLCKRHIPQTAMPSEEHVQEILPSPVPLGYRQRIRLQADPSGRLGFLGFRSHRIVPVDFCLVAAPELNTVLAGLARSSACRHLLGRCRELELLLNPQTSAVTCLFHNTQKPRPADIRQATELTRSIPLIERVFFQGDHFPLTGPCGGKQGQQTNTLQMQLPAFAEGDKALTLEWEVGGFCQVNLRQNERLIRCVLAACAPGPDESILDLFCGMGNFSIPLACRAQSLTGLEGQGAAIRSAVKNSLNAGLANTTFEKAPVHEACKQLAAQGRSFDCLVLDPPRQGVPGLARELALLTRRRMVYISCDPATLCRDLAELTGQGLQIRRMQPVDMFPQTHHIETVVLLEKN
jgi:23S rRNA (uracil1939-C5)-methyltransferase